jgi:hypothetical protein
MSVRRYRFLCSTLKYWNVLTSINPLAQAWENQVAPSAASFVNVGVVSRA